MFHRCENGVAVVGEVHVAFANGGVVAWDRTKFCRLSRYEPSSNHPSHDSHNQADDRQYNRRASGDRPKGKSVWLPSHSLRQQ